MPPSEHLAHQTAHEEHQLQRSTPPPPRLWLRPSSQPFFDCLVLLGGSGGTIDGTDGTVRGQPGREGHSGTQVVPPQALGPVVSASLYCLGSGGYSGLSLYRISVS